MAKLPSNTNIMDAVISLTKDVAKNQATQDQRHRQYSSEFKDIKMRQDHTNGNVKDLLLWQSNTMAAEKAVNEYKEKELKEKGAQVSTSPKVPEVSGVDWSKWVPFIITVAAALVAIGGAVSNGN